MKIEKLFASLEERFTHEISMLSSRPEGAKMHAELQEGNVALRAVVDEKDGRVFDYILHLSNGALKVEQSQIVPDNTLLQVRLPAAFLLWTEKRLEGLQASPGPKALAHLAALKRVESALQKDHTSFQIDITDGPWTAEGATTTIHIALGKNASLEKSECVAKLAFQDIWGCIVGDIAPMDLVFGRTEITGDATKMMKLLLNFASVFGA